jgi:anti-sigma factor RsiW
MKNPELEKLLLEAVEYVLDDLPPAEREAFEARLADDQAAREAVAEAVVLCRSLRAALTELVEEQTGLSLCPDGLGRPPHGEFSDSLSQSARAADGAVLPGAALLPASSVERLWRRPAFWAATAIAASIALVVFVADVARGPNLAQHPPAGAGRSGLDASVAERSVDGEKELAVAWLNSASLTDASDEAAVSESAINSDDDLALVDAHGDFVSPALSPESDWLFEAVTAPPVPPTGSNTPTPQEG